MFADISGCRACDVRRLPRQRSSRRCGRACSARVRRGSGGSPRSVSSGPPSPMTPARSWKRTTPSSPWSGTRARTSKRARSIGRSITPPEWRPINATIRENLETHGFARPRESECLRKDGVRVPSPRLGVAQARRAGIHRDHPGPLRACENVCRSGFARRRRWRAGRAGSPGVSLPRRNNALLSVILELCGHDRRQPQHATSSFVPMWRRSGRRGCGRRSSRSSSSRSAGSRCSKPRVLDLRQSRCGNGEDARAGSSAPISS